MIEEVRGPKTLTPVQGVLWTLAIAGGLLLWLFLVRLLIAWTGFAWLDGLFFLGVGTLVYLLMRERTMTCRYVLREDVLWLERAYGHRPQVQLHIPVPQMLTLAQVTAEQITAQRPKPLCVTRGHNPCWCISYREEGAVRAAIFQPSENLVQAIETARNGHPSA